MPPVLPHAAHAEPCLGPADTWNRVVPTPIPYQQKKFFFAIFGIFLSFFNVKVVQSFDSYLKYIDLLNLQTFGATSKFHNIIRPTFSEKNTNKKISSNFFYLLFLVNLPTAVFSYNVLSNYDFNFGFMHILSYYIYFLFFSLRCLRVRHNT